jgi:hypothetical protein
MWPSRAGARHEERAPARASCSLCGIDLPTDELMPDGGEACAEVRWYCLDTRGCTDRWTGRGRI